MNFDAKIRRNFTNMEDISMHTSAKPILLQEPCWLLIKSLPNLLIIDYVKIHSSFYSWKEKEFEEGKLALKALCEIAKENEKH